jgi:hypothetical protein
VTLFRYSEKVNEFTAYKGEKFTIEWYFDENGKSDVLNYFEKLPDSLKIKTLVLFKRFADVGEIKDKTKFNFAYNYGLPQRFGTSPCLVFDTFRFVTSIAEQSRAKSFGHAERRQALTLYEILLFLMNLIIIVFRVGHF